MTDNREVPPGDYLRLSHCSCVPWTERDRWARYFNRAEEILQASVTHLDQRDPVRRRVKPGARMQMADYVLAFGEHEGSRTVFGRMTAIGVEFDIWHFREVRGFANSMQWYLPEAFVDRASGNKAVRELFDCGNSELSAFYSYSDLQINLSLKKKMRTWAGAVNLQEELLGVFWLTYFGAHYVSFIGKERLKNLEDVNVSFDNGATLSLGLTPRSIPDGLRDRVEGKLGQKLFVQPNDFLGKRHGQYALTFDQLRRQ